MKNRLLAALVIGAWCMVATGASPVPALKQQVAPDFKTADLEQNTIRLSGFRDKKPVVLFFWTTWCPYCLRDLKKMNTDITTYRQEGIEVMAINVGEAASKAARLVKNYSLTYPVFLDEDSAIADLYDVMGVPAYVLIDKKGVIRSTANRFPHDEALELAKER
ncbi:MAG: TlpA disulfide reductase family protein [Candidatus Omnitrophica bacterium]|nr:TlpA disulfide reductase family protein [Candidatus Omnitrophota bacterium]